MAVKSAEGKAIADLCRSVGWKVTAGRNGEYLYRILPAGTDANGNPHKAVQIHGSPSDVNWHRTVMRQLNRAGLKEALAALEESDTAEAKARTEKARLKAEQDTARVEKKAREEAALLKAAGKFAGPQRVDLEWLTTPTEFPEARLVIIYPEDAEKILKDHNPLNRKWSQARVDYFKSVIRAGQFGATHQGGAFDWLGRLQDGQSRLGACVELQVPITMWWTVGQDPANFPRIDTGMNRNARDTVYLLLKELGYDGSREDLPDLTAYAPVLSSTAKMLSVYDTHGPDSHVRYKAGRTSNDTIGSVVRNYGQPLFDAVIAAKDIKAAIKKFNPSALSAAVYLITMRLPEGDERVVKFFKDIRTGAMIDEDDPVALLRKRFMNDDYPKLAWDQLALILTAWKQRCQGVRGGSNLVWRSKYFPAVFLPPKAEQEAA